MPDFERVLDYASIDLAKTPEDKAFAVGFVDGKNKARWEIVNVALVVAFGLFFGSFIMVI